MAQLFRQKVGWEALRLGLSPPSGIGQQAESAKADKGEGRRFRDGGIDFRVDLRDDVYDGDAVGDGEGGIDLLAGGIERVVSGGAVIRKSTLQFRSEEHRLNS